VVFIVSSRIASILEPGRLKGTAENISSAILYLEWSSPRRQQVQDYKREQGLDGAAAGQIAAHRTSYKKELLSPAEV
jgi:hypothetical protein